MQTAQLTSHFSAKKTAPPRVGLIPGDVAVFVGFTAKETTEEDLYKRPLLINSMTAYHALFGKMKPVIDVSNDEKEPVKLLEYGCLEASLNLFFENGGTRCYVLSAGLSTTLEPEAFLHSAVNNAADLNDASLLVCPDAALLPLEQSARIYQRMLEVCSKMTSCMALLDAPLFENVPGQRLPDFDFRNGLGTKNLKFGAAFYPWVERSETEEWTIEQLRFSNKEDLPKVWKKWEQRNTEIDGCCATLRRLFGKESLTTALQSKKQQPANDVCAEEVLLYAIFKKVEEMRASLKFKGVKLIFDAFYDQESSWSELQRYAAMTGNFPDQNSNIAFVEQQYKNLLAEAVETLHVLRTKLQKYKNDCRTHFMESDADFKALYCAIERLLRQVPPSGAVAGLYADVARNSGSWTAPEQLRLRGISGPVLELSNFEQEQLHTDAVSGKSINAIRSFSDTGTMIWASRTLDGLDARWRYVPVVRLSRLMEQSIRENFGWLEAVSDPQLYAMQVKEQLTTFLNELWEQGAFKGASARQAYYIQLGDPENMPYADALEGTLTIEVGMAIVRPNDFSIVKITIGRVE